VILALGLGASVNRVHEQKLMALVRTVEVSPTKEQGAQLSTLGAKARWSGWITSASVGVAVLCLAASRFVA
jgi:hypothetical protein